jgi:O-antigen ligase
VPVQELITLPAGLSVTQAALLLLSGSVLLHVLAHPERRLKPGPLFWPLTIFIWTLGLASALTPFSQAEALRETLRWVTVLLIYVAIVGQDSGFRIQDSEGVLHRSAVQVLPAGNEVLYAARPKEQNWQVLLLVICLLLAPAACAALGIYQFATGDGPPSFAIEGGRFVRAYGTIGQPNSFAGYMNMAWPLAAGLALSAGAELWQAGFRIQDSGFRSARASQRGEYGAKERNLLARRYSAGEGLRIALERTFALPSLGLILILLFSLTALALIGGGLLASFSRGGWVGAIGGAAAILVAGVSLLPAWWRRRAWAVFGVGTAAIVLLIVLGGSGVLPDSLERRVASITNNLRLFDVRDVSVNPENFAVVERMAHLQAAGTMLVRHPLTGVGPGNFSIAYEFGGTADAPPYFLHPWYTSRGHAHNYYVHIAAEDGLIGLAAFLLLLAATLRQAWRAVARAQGWLWRGVAIGGAGVVVAVATHDLFENLHALNLGLQLGAIWALLVVAERCSEAKKE